MAFNFTLPLRIVQAVFAIVVLGLTAYGISRLCVLQYPNANSLFKSLIGGAATGMSCRRLRSTS